MSEGYDRHESTALHAPFYRQVQPLCLYTPLVQCGCVPPALKCRLSMRGSCGAEGCEYEAISAVMV